MPELPEVEFIRRQLELNIAGKRIIRAELLRPGLAPKVSPHEFSEKLSGTTITTVLRRGKFLIFKLSGKQILAVHLRMTGKFSLLAADEELPKHTHALFELQGKQLLVFSDQRHFGRMILSRGNDISAIYELASLAPEPFQETFHLDDFRFLLRRSQRPIKEFLLDQTKVCGLGNIYVAEALFRAGIHPATKTSSIGPVRSRRLYQAILETVSAAISELPGRDFFSLRAVTQNYSETNRAEWLVYAREGQACHNCRAKIKSLRQGGRTTYFCPFCQKK